MQGVVQQPGARLQHAEIQRHHLPHPYRVVAMVGQFIAGARMDEHHQASAIERQPRHHLLEQRRCEGQLTAPARVRTDRPFVHASHADAEAAPGLLAKRAGLLDAVCIEVDVGVLAMDGVRVEVLHAPGSR